MGIARRQKAPAAYGGSPERRKRPQLAPSSRAFSLIEVLVGFAVLTILVTLLMSAFSNFTQVTTSSKKRIDVSKHPRTLFDRMAFDINSAVMSGGVRLEFAKNAALSGGTASRNDALVVLTEAKTRDPESRMAKIGYAVGPYDDQSGNMEIQTVLRYVEPFQWDDDTTVINVTSDIDAQPISPGIVRFELSFGDRDGEILAAPPAIGATAAEMREFHENLATIICTVATLDQDSLRKLSAAERDSIANRLPDAVDGESPLALWQAVDFSDLPRPVQQGLRFHQRYFRLQ